MKLSFTHAARLGVHSLFFCSREGKGRSHRQWDTPYLNSGNGQKEGSKKQKMGPCLFHMIDPAAEGADQASKLRVAVSTDPNSTSAGAPHTASREMGKKVYHSAKEALKAFEEPLPP
eukprot:scaffold102059_cov21-Tisochrysis_lutea.AAC.1